MLSLGLSDWLVVATGAFFLMVLGLWFWAESNNL